MTTSSTNYTGLYGGGAGGAIPNTAYGNANVVSLLAVGTDGGNTVGNISATGNITTGGILTDNYYYANGAPFSGGGGGTYGNSNVATYLASGALASNVITTANISGQYILGNGSQLTGLPATYGNANVATFLANFGSNSLSTTGNVTSGNVIVSGIVYTTQIESSTSLDLNTPSDVNANGNLRVGDNNANTQIATHGTGDLILRTHAGDATQGNIRLYDGANGNIDINPNGSGTVNITGTGGVKVSDGISATGNITGNYFLGNGSQLTGLPATYGNANVVTLLAGFGSNSISTTGNVTASYFAGDGSQLSNINAGNIVGSYGNANVANFLASYGSNTITTTGAIQGGTLSATGNVAGGNIIIPNGGKYIGDFTSTAAAGRTLFQTSNTGTTAATIITAVPGPNHVATPGVNGSATNLFSSSDVGNASLFGMFSRPDDARIWSLNQGTGNVNNITFRFGSTGTLGATLSNVGAFSAVSNVSGSNITTAGSVSATGNVTGAYIIGDGSQLTNLPTSSYGNANVANFLANFGSNTIVTTGNITGGNILSTLNMSAATITTTGTSGNISGVNYITANYFVGNGSLLTNINAANITGSYGNANVANFLANYGSNTISTTGNITGGNIATAGILSATGNLTGGNLFVTNSIINSTNAFSLSTSPATGRVIVGPGYGGDYSTTYDPLSINRGSQLAVMGKYNIANTDTNQSMRSMSSTAYFDLGGGTLFNANRRINAGAFGMNIANGTATLTTGGSLISYAGSGTALTVGNVGGLALGAATVSHAVGHYAGVNVQGGGTVGNAIGVLSNPAGGNTTAVITTQMGLGIQHGSITGQASPGNVFGVYMPGTTGTYGFTNGNVARAAANYYFLRNDDPVAQNQLGSLRSYTQYSYVNSTSGSITIDKNNGQVQQVELTGNVTNIAFSNFVTTASDSVNTDYQSDTVTVAFNQGATGGYGVTFPTPSGTIKYANGVSTLSSTAANSVTLVSISAMYLSGNTTYLITISPGFV